MSDQVCPPPGAPGPAGGIITGARPSARAGPMEHRAGNDRLDGTSGRLDQWPDAQVVQAELAAFADSLGIAVTRTDETCRLQVDVMLST